MPVTEGGVPAVPRPFLALTPDLRGYRDPGFRCPGRVRRGGRRSETEEDRSGVLGTGEGRPEGRGLSTDSLGTALGVDVGCRRTGGRGL